MKDRLFIDFTLFLSEALSFMGITRIEVGRIPRQRYLEQRLSTIQNQNQTKAAKARTREVHSFVGMSSLKA